MTTGAPDPTSTIFNSQLPTSNSPDYRLVPQRLPGLERVCDAFVCLPFRVQAEECLTFKIEELLFADDAGVGQRASRHDGYELAADQSVVVADASGAMCQVDTQLQRRGDRVAA